MLISLGIILLSGMFFSFIARRIRIPNLIFLILIGMLMGPYAFNLIDPSLLNISKEIREVALIVILTRAGLSLKLKDLQKLGRPAILLSFLPASLEILAFTLITPLFFEIGHLDALLLGSVIAAVSPAIVVPRMLNIMKTEYGKKSSVPQLILLSSSIDDIIVIVLFTTILDLKRTGILNLIKFLSIPFSLITGLMIGIILGKIIDCILKKFLKDPINKLIIVFGATLIILGLEKIVSSYIPFSSLLAIIFMGITIKKLNPELAHSLEIKYNSIWKISQILLFVLLGAAVNINYIYTAGMPIILIILIALLLRMFGVFLSLLKTEIERKERLFVMLSYTPKATVQAAIGAVALEMGIESGNIILTFAVVSILITAPLGAILIDKSYQKLLIKS